tara:strand:- start:1974 stop:3287 length:1314 start_codon:yes stop_codon:yes gene_type:complete
VKRPPNLFALDRIAGLTKSRLLPMATLLLVIFTLLPGIPHIVILLAAAFAGGIACYLIRKPAPGAETGEPAAQNHLEPIGDEDVSDNILIAVEIGYGLFPLVEDGKGTPLMTRIAGVRSQMSAEIGFAVPFVQIKVNLSLEPNAYRIAIDGVIMGEGAVWPDELVALDDGYAESAIEGRPCKDPTFRMDAFWISLDTKSLAIAEGYIVIDGSTMIATHLSDIVRRNAAKLFGMEDAQKLLDLLSETSPEAVSNITAQSLSVTDLTTICLELLGEKVPIKAFQQIFLAILEASRIHSEMPQMVDAVRQNIGQLIVQSMVPTSLPLPVVTLDTELESLMVKALQLEESGGHSIEPRLAQEIIQAFDGAAWRLPSEVRNVALITLPVLRRPLSILLKQRFPDLTVLSYRELPDDKSIEVLTKIGVPQSDQTMAATDANQI